MAAEPTTQATSADSQRGLRRIWTAVAVSSLGDGAFLAALPLAAAALTRNPVEVAAVSVTMYLPWAIVTPLAGALVDRWPYRATMLTADTVRAAALTGLAVLLAYRAATIPLLCVVAAVVVCGQIFHDTAVQGTVVALAGRDRTILDRINSRIYGTETAGRQLVGPPAGSASYTLGAWLPFAADAASFAGSAAALLAIPRGLRAPQAGPRQSLVAAIKEGAQYLLRSRLLRTLTVVSAGGNFAWNMAMATFVLLATARTGLGITTAAFGLLLAAQAAGGVLAGLLTGRITSRLSPGRTLIAVSVIHGLAWPVIAALHNPWAAAPLLAAIGASQSVITVVNVSTRQALVPPALLGRVITAMRTVGNSAGPAGALIGGLIASTWGLRTPLVVAGVVLGVVAVATAPTLARRIH
jgi:MFS family permease